MMSLRDIRKMVRDFRAMVADYVETVTPLYCEQRERERPGGEEWDDVRRRTLEDFLLWLRESRE